MKLTIGKAAKELGVTIETLRRWEKEGKITAERTRGGHRRFDIQSLRGLERRPKPLLIEQISIAYARVSSRDQKEDLIRQSALLESYCLLQKWEYELIEDIGTGLNYKKKGLRKLIEKICSYQIERLVLTHKDRLLRFGSQLIFELCDHFGVEIVILQQEEPRSFEEELAKDVLEIITVFSAKLYGSRSHKNKKLMRKLQNVAEEISEKKTKKKKGK